MKPMNSQTAFEFISAEFESTVLPTLCEYIKIPSSSPAYDTGTNSTTTEQVIELMVKWVSLQNIEGLELHVRRIEGRTPLIFLKVIGAYTVSPGSILMYGHPDKQPPFSGWNADLGPYIPVIKENQHGRVLYGRAGADDGYAIFGAVLALKALKAQGIPFSDVFISTSATMIPLKLFVSQRPS